MLCVPGIQPAADDRRVAHREFAPQFRQCIIFRRNRQTAGPRPPGLGLIAASVACRERAALRIHTRLAAARPYRSASGPKSPSGSCIRSAVLAAVLPRPSRARSITATRAPAFAKKYAEAQPVTPPPTMTTS